MYKKILVPLDGSNLAEGVLPHAQAFAERDDAEIILLRVAVEPMYDRMFTGAKLAAATQDNAKAGYHEAKIYVDSIGASLKQSGVKVMTEVRDGIVAEAILGYAKESGVDLLVLSAHGHGKHAGSVLGSITYRLVRGAHVPVLLIP